MIESVRDFGAVKERNIKNTMTLIKSETTFNSGIQDTYTRVIAVTSGKGGVGKSTLCVNLGISLAKKGQKVLLLDGDLGLANLNVLMGIIPEFGIYDVIRGKKSLEDVIISTSFGLDIISGANGISQLADINQKQREAFLAQIGELEGYDVMLIDTSAGIGANVLGFALASDDILVVTTPEPTAITDAYAMIKSILMHEANKPVHLLVNRVSSTTEAKMVAKRLRNIVSRFLNADLENIGFIFEEDLVQKSVASQRPLVTTYPSAKSTNCISHIGSHLIQKNKEARGNGLKEFFRSLMGKNQKNQIGIFD